MNICFEYMIHIMNNKTDNMNKNEYREYTLVYKDENEKKLFTEFTDDYNYKKLVQDFNLEIKKYNERIDNLNKFVKEEPTYNNLINYNAELKRLCNNKNHIENNKDLLNNCLQIEEHFEYFYKEIIDKQQFQMNITSYIPSYKSFVQCKPYLQSKFQNRLNIDFTGVVYDDLKNQQWILNKELCSLKYSEFNEYRCNWIIEHDFDNGYYYRISENYNQKR